jgi:hypothetical protein
MVMVSRLKLVFDYNWSPTIEIASQNIQRELTDWCLFLKQFELHAQGFT